MCSAHGCWVHCSQLMQQPYKYLAVLLLLSLFMRLACLVTSALMRKEGKDQDWRADFPFVCSYFLDKLPWECIPDFVMVNSESCLHSGTPVIYFFFNCMCSVLKYRITYWIQGRPCPSVYSVQSYLDNFYSNLCF